MRADVRAVWQTVGRRRRPLCNLKHRRPLTAVALSERLAVTGDDRGRIKVWDLKSFTILKWMRAHQAPVTALRLDRWHIASASLDNYAKVWSAVGRFDRCLMPLRHTRCATRLCYCTSTRTHCMRMRVTRRPVTALELLYLRLVTACEDGRVRVWNMLTGHCCRILRGNSRSDPILCLAACPNRCASVPLQCSTTTPAHCTLDCPYAGWW